MSSSSTSPERDTEPDIRPRKRVAKERAPPKLRPALYKASVKTLAATENIQASSSTLNIDDAILKRIKKCLDRGNHPNTPEPEAKAALYKASRLMGQYNVSQAEILAHETPEAQQQYAGQSVVAITRADGSNAAVNMQSFVSQVARAMETFFDCKCYSTKRLYSIEWTFYGIAQNTVTAAMAFEMAFNLICEWARPYKGQGCKNSYCSGAADELDRMARREKVAQDKQAKESEREAIRVQVEQEEAAREAELARLQIEPVSPEEEEDEESIGGVEMDFEETDADLDIQGDVDDDIARLVKTEPQDDTSQGLDSLLSPPTTVASPIKAEETEPVSITSIKQEDQENPEDDDDSAGKSLWASSMQLVKFRADATRIADDYLTGAGIKLSKGRKSQTVIRDREAYRQGVRDGKKIDVRGKRIEEKA